jgi:CRP-like cAMP-binding protein
MANNVLVVSRWIESRGPIAEGAQRLTHEQLQTVESDPWFASMPAELQRALLRHASVRNVCAQHALAEQGKVPASFFCIVNGAVKLSVMSDSGREVVMDVLQGGDWFGGPSLLEGLPLPYSASCWSACTVLVISAAAMCQVHAVHPALGPALVRLAWHRGSRVVKRASQLGEGTLHDRARRELQALYRRFGIQSGATRTLPFLLTQTELAKLLNASRQRVNLVLRQLENEGFLRRVRGKLLLVDPT